MIRPVDESHDPLARLARAAGERPLPESSDVDMVTTALLAARGRARRRRRTRLRASAAILLLGVAGVAWGVWPREDAGLEARASEPSSLEPSSLEPSSLERVTRPEEGLRTEAVVAESTLVLPTGDRIVHVGEDALDVLSLGRDRRFSLARGEVLFEVPPLETGHTFEVRTPHLRARVVGTIFAVSAEAETSAVEVYEGEVEVIREGQPPLRVIAGESWSVSGAWSSRLANRGREAAARRLANSPVAPGESAPSRTVTEAASAPTLPEVQTWLADGEIERALAAASAGARREPRSGPWRMLLGDAQRVSGSPTAAETYDEAVTLLSESRATQAGYLAAELRLARGDAAGALRSLTAARATERGSPIAERATALQLRALERTGDAAQLQRVARVYLLNFPAGAARGYVEGLLAAD